MVDTLTPKQRSERMALIRSKGTKLERAVMGLVHGLGYRYLKHRRDLPGTPDMAFPARRKAIFVHGCFWHGHRCKLGRMPKSRVGFWSRKIANNKKRDQRALAGLRRLGWRSLVIWECQTRDLDKVARRARKFLGDA
jgi:DNA mismatch endonuclease (patch repair protein)